MKASDAMRASGAVELQILGPDFSNFVRTVMLVCEEKGISYRTGLQLDGQKITFHGDDHMALHPWGKIPVVRHQGVDLYETASICRYLERVFPHNPLLPEEAVAAAKTDQWCAAISGYVDQALVRRYLLEFAFPKGENGSIRMDKVAEVEPDVRKTLALLTDQLADQSYICGKQLTLADLLLLPMLDYLAGLPHGEALIEPGTPLAGYLVRLRQRPSAQWVLQGR